MKPNAQIIGIAGVARAGKDTFARLTKTSDIFKDKKVRTLAFADRLKEDAGQFLKNFCNVPDVTRLTGESKTDVRPFLVWYGCFMRKQNPLHWVLPVAQEIAADMKNDVLIVTDVRFQNEAQWIHNLGGKVVHVKRYQADPYQNSLVPPANDEEKLNDPMVDVLADSHVRWPTVTDEHLNDLQKYVNLALQWTK